MFNDNKEILSNVINVMMDSGYTEKNANEVMNIIRATVEVAKRSELHKFKAIPKCLVVERSFN